MKVYVCETYLFVGSDLDRQVEVDESLFKRLLVSLRSQTDYSLVQLLLLLLKASLGRAFLAFVAVDILT